MGNDATGLKRPKISVIMPTYNQAQFLGDAIKDIINQSFQDFELIIVNDGSDDDTARNALRVQTKLKGGRIVQSHKFRYFEHDRNQGEPAALMTGIKHAYGEYISFCTSDCRYSANWLQDCYNAIKGDPEVAYAYGNFYFIDKSGIRIREFKRREFNFEQFTRGFIVSGYGVMRAAFAKKCLPIVDVGYGWDWKWYLELAQHGKFIRVPEFVASWRDWDGNTTMKMRTGQIKAWRPSREYLECLTLNSL